MILGEGEIQPGQLERFRIEARRHRPAAACQRRADFEIGEVAGQPFFSLELLEGRQPRRQIAAAPQSPSYSTDLLITLALAVQAARDARVIHRDLKPLNVLFHGNGTPKITDFGPSQALDVQAVCHRHWVVVIRRIICPPEQAGGLHRRPAADIYALGAILYAMLTGRPPLQGTSAPETLKMVIEVDPGYPPGEVQPKIPRDLETICLKCLAKPQHRRYASAELSPTTCVAA